MMPTTEDAVVELDLVSQTDPTVRLLIAVVPLGNLWAVRSPGQADRLHEDDGDAVLDLLNAGLDFADLTGGVVQRGWYADSDALCQRACRIIAGTFGAPVAVEAQ